MANQEGRRPAEAGLERLPSTLAQLRRARVDVLDRLLQFYHLVVKREPKTRKAGRIWDVQKRRINLSKATSEGVNFFSSTDFAMKDEIMATNDKNLAMGLALDETELIKQTKEWLMAEGIAVQAFERKSEKIFDKYKNEPAKITERSKTTLIIKNLPIPEKGEKLKPIETELRSLFEKFGKVERFAISPEQSVGIVKFEGAYAAGRAFENLVFKRFRTVALFLEFAPSEEFKGESIKEETSGSGGNLQKETDMPEEGEKERKSTRLFKRMKNN